MAEVERERRGQADNEVRSTGARPCHLPQAAPPCIGCRCGVVTFQEARDDGREVRDAVLDDAVSRTRYRALRGEAAYPDDLETIIGAAYRKHPEPEITEARDDVIANAAEGLLDAETHDDLCACATYPEDCATYGTRRPWSHSDPGRWTRAVLEAALRVPVGEGKQG
ncbi:MULTISPECIES: hypothetical protein [unclassified Microbacterium]|uniref:hypothetical protein n=1 Tax=unclassified Microbacterium TaxID=2609290 RepID=UPI0038635802